MLKLELASLSFQKKDNNERLEAARKKREDSEKIVENIRSRYHKKKDKIDLLEAEGRETVKDKIQLEGMAEEMAEEENNFSSDTFVFAEAEADLADVTRTLESRQLQYDALQAEQFQLKRGMTNASFWPRPMVYTVEGHSDDAELAREEEGQTVHFKDCQLCFFAFPNLDIVITSCGHAYHPYCAAVVFANARPCMAFGCNALPHPNWFSSFGWGQPSAQLVEIAEDLGLKEKRQIALQARADEAIRELPVDHGESVHMVL